jgi:hypothetical protein
VARWTSVSCGGNRILPPGGCLDSEYPKDRPRDEMSLMVEGIVDGGMDVEKMLSGSRRFEPLQFCALVAARFDASFQRVFFLRPRS